MNLYYPLSASIPSLISTILRTLFQNDPLYTVIDTVSYPVQNNPFPSVTVCPPGRDRWAFIEKVFNQVKFQCYKGYTYTEQDCIDSQKARLEFQFLLEEIHEKATLL